MSAYTRISYRPTWAEVRLGNLAHNYRVIAGLLEPGTKIMVCVKADAYGHGLVPVSKKLVGCGVDYFGVASIDEGIQLRESGIKTPILVLGVTAAEVIEPLLRYRLTPAVCTRSFVLALDREGKRAGRRIPVHVKIDTGMGRIGVSYGEAFLFVRDIARLKSVRLEGVFTHLACADTDRRFTLQQIRLLDGLISRLKASGVRVPLVHAANSMAVIDYKESHFNMVRPGLAMYGLYPKPGLKVSLKPVLSLKTKIVYLKKVPRGTGISYGHTYVTHRATHIATLPIGYGDGYPRNLSNCAPVLINGRVFRISGRVCMDQMMVDVGHAKAMPGDEAVLIGSQRGKRITAENLAELAGTIPYEIVCGLGSRIPRVYI